MSKDWSSDRMKKAKERLGLPSTTNDSESKLSNDNSNFVGFPSGRRSSNNRDNNSNNRDGSRDNSRTNRDGSRDNFKRNGNFNNNDSNRNSSGENRGNYRGNKSGGYRGGNREGDNSNQGKGGNYKNSGRDRNNDWNNRDKYLVKISGCDPEITRDDLWSQISPKWGEIQNISVKVYTSKDENGSERVDNCCAFVNFYNLHAARYFVEAHDGTTMGHSIISVDLKDSY